MTAHKTLTARWAAGTDQYRALIAARRDVLRREIDDAIPAGAPVVWEIGCGHGHFLTAYAQAHPEKLCVGVDVVGERVERAVRKRDRARLPNLHFFHADALLFLDTLPASVQFTAVFVLFPDPWPKLRHQKHRILQPAFLDLLAGRAAANCRLYFRTDHDAYFQQTLETIRSHARWELASDPWPFEFETVFQSRAPRYDSLIARPRS